MRGENIKQRKKIFDQREMKLKNVFPPLKFRQVKIENHHDLNLKFTKVFQRILMI